MIDVASGNGVTVFSSGGSAYALVEVKKEINKEVTKRVPRSPKPHDFCGCPPCSLCFYSVVEKIMQVEIMYQVYKILPVMETVIQKGEKTKVIQGPDGPLIVKDPSLRTYENDGWGQRYIRKLLAEEIKAAEQEKGAKELQEALAEAEKKESLVEYLIEEMKVSR
jgi:hypothetical protein